MIWKWVKLLPTFRAILMRSGSKSRVLGRVMIFIFLSGNLPSGYPFGVFRFCYNESFECWVLGSIISNFITNLDLLVGAVVLIIFIRKCSHVFFTKFLSNHFFSFRYTTTMICSTSTNIHTSSPLSHTDHISWSVSELHTINLLKNCSCGPKQLKINIFWNYHLQSFPLERILNCYQNVYKWFKCVELVLFLNIFF